MLMTTRTHDFEGPGLMVNMILGYILIPQGNYCHSEFIASAVWSRPVPKCEWIDFPTHQTYLIPIMVQWKMGCQTFPTHFLHFASLSTWINLKINTFSIRHHKQNVVPWLRCDRSRSTSPADVRDFSQVILPKKYSFFVMMDFENLPKKLVPTLDPFEECRNKKRWRRCNSQNWSTWKNWTWEVFTLSSLTWWSFRIILAFHGCQAHAFEKTMSYADVTPLDRSCLSSSASVNPCPFFNY